MSDHDGPWGAHRPPPAPRARRRSRVILWLALLATACAGIWMLERAFPGQLSGADRAYVWLDFGLLALVSSGIVLAPRRRLGEVARHALIWAGVATVLVLGYTFRDGLLWVALKVRSELIPAYAVAAAPHTLVLNQSDDGNFYVMGVVNGTPVRFLVDTGASDIVLSPGDAERLGIDLASLKFDRPYQTANGTGFGASIAMDRLSVGPIRLTQVPVSINQASMETSLLGMTFFRKLDSFEIRGGRLFLKWRG
jgi:aspartyl protease family protein